METKTVLPSDEEIKIMSVNILKEIDEVKKPIKWSHIHWYNILYHPIHKSEDGKIVEEMHNINLYKCRCGKLKD